MGDGWRQGDEGHGKPGVPLPRGARSVQTGSTSSFRASRAEP